MRHHGGPQNAEGEVQHFGVVQNFGGRRETVQNSGPVGVGHRNLQAKADGDDRQKRHDEAFQLPKTPALQVEDQEHIKRGDQHTQLQRDAEQQVQADGGADHLGDVGGDDGYFRCEPERDGHQARESVAAGLGEVAAGGDGEAGRQRLQDDRHQVGEERHEQQGIAELGPAGQRGRPVAGVHVADRDHIARP